MTGIQQPDGTIIPFQRLPAKLQKAINKYAVLDILKDEAKEVINAKRADIKRYTRLWLDSKAPKTRENYRKALADFSDWMSLQGVPSILLCKAEHVDAYISHLKTKLESNTIRTKCSSISSFFTTMMRYRRIQLNPFHKAPLPPKVYKKSIKPIKSKTIPVMSPAEYKAIVEHIEQESVVVGRGVSFHHRRQAAKRLLPAVKMMADYGLRVGAIPTIERTKKHFAYTTKGDKTFVREVGAPFPPGRRPFGSYKVITIQKAFARITAALHSKGLIRHRYSCHDLRHYYATQFYNATKDIVLLKQNLNHASINVTDIYLQSVGAQA